MIAAPQLAHEPCSDGRVRRLPTPRPERRSGTPVPRRLRPERIAWIMDAAIIWSRFGIATHGMFSSWLLLHPEREIATLAGWCAACGVHMFGGPGGSAGRAHEHNADRHPRRYRRTGCAL